MLEIKNIIKEYKTGSFTQKALDGVNINFRSNELASILGPSGSGKTTFLNIVGGLDTYDSGDLIINEVSTKKYKSKDWDMYRNHRVGFVFQSYNLISHQSILNNVELALTLSGVSKKERKRRAKRALKDVGLENHINKKPNQLSGGQMQRVAIARALVNNPDILLADEPTGALDSTTSKQIMDLLKEIAKTKLVIMVTHNPELAKEYSTRIIKLKDGKVVDDTNPYDGKENTILTSKELKKINKKKSMSLLTALGLSLNNLLTKKGRTFLTSFAGSIGIIGIALILSLSNGVQEYIDKTEKETLSNYPISLESQTYDLTSMMNSSSTYGTTTNEEECKENKICTTDDISTNQLLKVSSSLKENNLTEFKKYITNNAKSFEKVTTDIQYLYNLDLQIYKVDDGSYYQVNPSEFNLIDEQNQTVSSTYSIGNTSTQVFKELINNDDLLDSQYKVLSGKLPSNYDEMVLVVDENNNLPLSVVYSLGLENATDIQEKIAKVKSGEEVKFDTIEYDYSSLMNNNYKLILNTDYYAKENGVWKSKKDNESYMKKILDNGISVKIVGIVKLTNSKVETGSGYVGYTHQLTEYVINQINKQDIVKEQINNDKVDIFTGNKFNENISSYENNMALLGVNNLEEPSGINIYPKDFSSKEEIENLINKYNDIQKENDKEDNIITYNDYVGILLSSVTSIVDIISIVLIAFVAVSLVVSSIMIAIITYISVLERTKEIGILRAIGASKKDVRRVFNAETIIEGLMAGVLGVTMAYLITIPANNIISDLLDVENLTHLPFKACIILILISVFLTVIAGLIPSNMASKKDPVVALRSE